MSKFSTIIAVGMMLAAGTAQAKANAKTSIVADLLAVESSLNEMCRGGAGDSTSTDAACETRTQVERILEKAGYCNGMLGQSTSESIWHKCAKGSRHFGDQF